MNLEEFVTEALKQIITGVENAQAIAHDKGAAINPRDWHHMVDAADQIKYETAKGEKVRGQLVEFDVAVVATEDKSIKGGIGIFGGPIGIGYQANKAQDNSTVSRIKFTVSVFLPRQKK